VSRCRVALVVALVLAGLGGVALGVAALLPMPAGDARPGREDRSGRRARGPSCGLSEIATPDGCAPAVVTAVREEPVTFPSEVRGKGRAQLTGTLTVPTVAGSARRPAVVLLHGSGPATRDGVVPGEVAARFATPFPVLRALAAELARAGFVVLRYDKRTCGACYGRERAYRFADFRVEDLLADARGAVAYLARRPEVDGNVVLVGHSEGAHLAPFVATGRPVAAAVLLGGFAQGWDRELLDQLERAAQLRARRLDVVTAWQLRREARSYARCFAELRAGAVDPARDCIGGGTPQGFVTGYLALNARLAAKLQAVDYPIMVLQGAADRNSAPENPARYAAMLVGRDAEVHVVPGVGHSLTNLARPAQPVGLDAEVVRRLRVFLAAVATRAPEQ
jgi:pimeloyl-ACP methyl ester carboxylesterase